jgi:hypothetical protein
VLPKYGDWVAYQFDRAVHAIGQKVDGALSKNSAQEKKRRKPDKVIIARALGETPAGRGGIATMPQNVPVVTVKPGEGVVEAMLRAEREGVI